ncbi:MAG: hypothetical protein AVO35_08595 [Candidatus Aegiribacteria sp. MLS_C]|nr:MAG: hypothetical protein AVO35_08595 [Candidatus Aegiribacteria sp. MLS_C]
MRFPTASRPLLAVSVFLVTFLVNVAGRNVQSFDSIWSVHTARSILLEGNTDLDEYDRELAAEGYRDLLEIEGHYYTIFPVGPSLMALPFVGAGELLFRHVVPAIPSLETRLRAMTVDDIGELDSVSFHKGIEVVTASFIVALASVFILLIGLRLTGSIPLSLALVFIFSLCSPAVSTASRGLWPHGPSMLMLALTLYLLTEAEKRPSLAACCSLPLAFSFVIRPTNAVPVLLLTIFVFIRYRKQFIRYLLWSLPVALPFVAFNLSVYGFPVSPYYLPGRLDSGVNLLVSLPGTLISPGRGLFVFSPVLLFALWGIRAGIRKRKLLDMILTGVLVLHWVIISSFKQWWGGHAFGPRYFGDVLPVLVYFLVPALQWMRRERGRKRTLVTSVFIILAAVSFVINIYGANSWAVMEWNAEPADVDLHTDRLWDWGDPQFLR